MKLKNTGKDITIAGELWKEDAVREFADPAIVENLTRRYRQLKPVTASAAKAKTTKKGGDSVGKNDNR